jgi:outer membrane protein TolC
MKSQTYFMLVVLAFLLAAAMGGFIPSSRADEGLSLEQAVEEGVGQSPTLKKYDSAKTEAHWGKVLGFSELVPHVDLVAEHDFAARYPTVPVSLGPVTAAVPEVAPRTSYGVQANWTLFNGLANLNTYRASLDLSHASEKEYSRKDFETRKGIELAFFDALAAQKFEEVAEENVKTLQENSAQVHHRLDSGVATKYDVLRVDVQLSDAQTELERTKDNVVIERKKLAEVMGLEQDSRPLIGKLPAPQGAKQIETLSPPDVTQREDFQAVQLRSEAADKQAQAANGNLLPAIGIAADYEKYDNTDYPDQAYGGFRDAWNVGVYVKWHIFDGGATVARSGMARAEAARADHAYQETVLTLPADFELWRRRYVYSAHRFDAKNDDLKRSEESYRISQASFQQGRNTITDVLEAQTDLFRARAGVVQSQLDAEEALVKLELTLGKELSI